MTKGLSEQEERALLMQEWASVVHYWSADNSILWQRCSVFLVVNSLLFTAVVLARPDAFLATWMLKQGIPIFATFINTLWWLVTLRSVAVIGHFEQRVEQIREKVPILRFYSRSDRESQFHHWFERVEGKKHILNLLPCSFLVLWIGIFVFLLAELFSGGGINMSDWLSVAAIVISVVIGVPALVLGILNYLDTKRIRQEIDGSLGTPAVQIQWGKPNDAGRLPCRVSAVFNPVSAVRLTVRREEKTIDELGRGEGKDLEFNAVPEGTKFKLRFTDPVEPRNYEKKGVIRYEQLDF